MLLDVAGTTAVVTGCVGEVVGGYSRPLESSENIKITLDKACRLWYAVVEDGDASVATASH